jgi:tetratricopeptide (TPR) repeat protein
MADDRLTLFVSGRLRGLPRAQLRALVARAGGRVVASASPRVDLVAVGHSTAASALDGAPPLQLPAGMPRCAVVISERNLKRVLGLEPNRPPETREHTIDDLARVSGTTPDLIYCLAAYDVFDPDDGRFGYRDLVVARELKRLLKDGAKVPEIVKASNQLLRTGHSLADTHLTVVGGEVVQKACGSTGDLDAQFALELGDKPRPPASALSQGTDCELPGDLAGAEASYRVAIANAAGDPLPYFKLGNVLEAVGRRGEAMLAYQQALTQDADFADAWLALGAAHEMQFDLGPAIECYQKATAARPDDADALYRLALLLTGHAAYDEALPLWRRYLTVPTIIDNRPRALRLLSLCQVSARCDRDHLITELLLRQA